MNNMNNQGQMAMAGYTRSPYGQPFQPELTQGQEVRGGGETTSIFVKIISVIGSVGIIIISLPFVYCFGLMIFAFINTIIVMLAMLIFGEDFFRNKFALIGIYILDFIFVMISIVCSVYVIKKIFKKK
jgi:hypothetical protein